MTRNYLEQRPEATIPDDQHGLWGVAMRIGERSLKDLSDPVEEAIRYQGLNAIASALCLLHFTCGWLGFVNDCFVYGFVDRNFKRNEL